jgi:GxxExxY protein
MPTIDFPVPLDPLPSIPDLSSLSRLLPAMCSNIYAILGDQQTESAYQNCLKVDLEQAGVEVADEVEIKLSYKGVVVGTRRADLVLTVPSGEKTVIELKACYDLSSLHMEQLRYYMQALDIRHGYLINFPHQIGFPELNPNTHLVLTNLSDDETTEELYPQGPDVATIQDQIIAVQVIEAKLMCGATKAALKGEECEPQRRNTTGGYAKLPASKTSDYGRNPYLKPKPGATHCGNAQPGRKQHSERTRPDEECPYHGRHLWQMCIFNPNSVNYRPDLAAGGRAGDTLASNDGNSNQLSSQSSDYERNPYLKPKSVAAHYGSAQRIKEGTRPDAECPYHGRHLWQMCIFNPNSVNYRPDLTPTERGKDNLTSEDESTSQQTSQASDHGHNPYLKPKSSRPHYGNEQAGTRKRRREPTKPDEKCPHHRGHLWKMCIFNPCSVNFRPDLAARARIEGSTGIGSGFYYESDEEYEIDFF